MDSLRVGRAVVRGSGGLAAEADLGVVAGDVVVDDRGCGIGIPLLDGLDDRAVLSRAAGRQWQASRG